MPFPQAGPALFRLVRFWSRRWAPGVANGVRGEPENVQNVFVVEAVDGAGHQAEVTVADIAHQLGLDRSVASRMVSIAVDAGYVRRGTSEVDARRASLALTETGQRFLADSHAFQQRTFDDMVAGWPEADRHSLARYLRRLATELIDADRPAARGG
ncbi:MarR family transcriptional regulator [Amycolatopsis antarctica]|uniref:MarR family transcriptional regulator n=1 Tax=Amycolatopsis antarctica TaxID=1854586 RepID=A0A263D820_9PSEU|nr:MarR family transcriptional regulator [Amycolatopsis antarctica]